MHSATDRVIAANVADLANTQHITLRELADESGIALDRLRAYLASDRGALGLAEIEALAGILGTTVAALNTPGAA